MSNLQVGMLGILLLFAMLVVRVPIGAAMCAVSAGGILIIRGPTAALGMLGNVPHEFSGNWLLSAVPMFLLMGGLAYRLRLTEGLYRVARAWLGRAPGGLAIATTWACTAFGAASGSSVATTGAMGKLAIPEMLRYGYSPALATGSVAAAGTIAALIPPSIAFVIYGWYAEVAIDKLLIAGVLPGLLTAAVYTIAVLVACSIWPHLAPVANVRSSWDERLRGLGQVWPMPLLILSVMGLMWGGFATSTEAAAMGAAIALAIGALKRTLTLAALRDSSMETARSVAALFFVVVGAAMFTRFLTLTGIPDVLSHWLAGLGSPAYVLAIMVVLYVLLGMFLDPIGVMLLTLPVLLPVCRAAGMDLIWIGVLVVKLVEVGMLTPPVGFHCFVLKSVASDVPLTTIFRGALALLVADAFVLALLIAFPAISLWLPTMMK